MESNETVSTPTGWKCTGYTHGCFCPSCDARDIARAEWLADAARAQSVGDFSAEAEARARG